MSNKCSQLWPILSAAVVSCIPHKPAKSSHWPFQHPAEVHKIVEKLARMPGLLHIVAAADSCWSCVDQHLKHGACRRSDRRRAKYELEEVVRSHLGADDGVFNAIRHVQAQSHLLHVLQIMPQGRCSLLAVFWPRIGSILAKDCPC